MGEKAVVMAVADDAGDGMQCTDHPYRANPGGICAFCLQDKLGKLVSSSSPSSFFPPASSTSSSDFPASSAMAATKKKKHHHHHHNYRPPPQVQPPSTALALKRSKSVAPRPAGDIAAASADSPRKKSFWSFLSLSSRSTEVQPQINQQHQHQHQHQHQEHESTSKKTADHDAESPSGGSQASSSSFGRKVARSRSVGCGSRSFSGDFLERISTGLGDCTLRRVESQRENGKHVGGKMVARRDHDGRIKERMKCGGIFGGFGVISSSTSYWLSAAAAAAADDDDFGSTSSRMSSSARRNRNWGWAFASPMRAFKPVSASKPFGPANAITSINSSTDRSGSKLANGNPPCSLAAVAAVTKT